MRMGVAGIAGRMGRLLVEEIRAAGHEMVGGICRPPDQPPGGETIFPDIAALAAAADLVIDFTAPEAAPAHAAALAAAGRPYLVGTTGLSAAQEAALRQAASRIPVMYAPNYAPGVTLALVLAERIAAALPAADYDAEIVEMHHRQKVDAPSGTALGLGQAVAAGRGVVLADVAESGRDGHTGPRRPGAIGFAALRGGQVVGEHSVIFAGASEHLALTHRAFDRRVFATGAVRAAAWLAARPPGLYDMRDVLGLR